MPLKKVDLQSATVKQVLSLIDCCWLLLLLLLLRLVFVCIDEVVSVRKTCECTLPRLSWEAELQPANLVSCLAPFDGVEYI